jgi:hypothetical protein
VQRLVDPPGHRLDHGGGRGRDPLTAAVGLLEAHDARRRPLRLEVGERLGGGAAEAVDRLVVVAGRGDLAAVGHEQPQQQPLGEARVLQVVHQHVPVAAREPRTHVRFLAQQPEGAQHEVAEVQRPRLAQHPVVRAEQLAELALAGGARPLGLAERRRPGGVVLAGDELVLEAVDPADDRAEHRARVAAQVVVAQRQIVDALEQHREPVGRGDRRGERVDAGLERLVVQQPCAEALEGRDRGLLGGRPAEPLLDPLAQRVGGRREHEDALGRHRVGRALCEPGEALDERRGLACARTADDEQRPPAVLDGLVLGGGEHFGN